MENIIENSIGAITQPWLVPFDTVNASDYVPWSCILAIMPSWKDRVTSTNVSGRPTFVNSIQSPVLLTGSKVLLDKVYGDHVEVLVLFATLFLRRSCQ